MAGREFETTEEADEWLSYATVQEYGDFDKDAGLVV